MRIFVAACLSLLTAMVAFAGPLYAADAAERAILGFSPDGRWFAFEEYGIQDGSGAPYANVYVVDLDMDRWARHTPVRVLLNNNSDNQPRLSVARRAAEARAAPVLRRLHITEPGIVLGSNPPTEINNEAYHLTVRSHYNLAGPEHKLAFDLEVFDAEGGRSCFDPGQKPKGFSLSVARGFEPRREVHRDAILPPSRGCPVDYGIADVIRYDPDPAGTSPRFVVLVHVFRNGFEGHDMRFLAVPVRLPRKD